MSIYKQYCNEIVDENGRLQKLTLEYPDNFNFGYDVVDKIADETPEKRALVWCNVEGEEHICRYKEIQQSDGKCISQCGNRSRRPCDIDFEAAL